MKKENVICIPTEILKDQFDLVQQSWPIDIELLNSLEFSFLPRQEVENDFSQKQIIPYAIVVNDAGEVLCYQRAGSEKRLSGIWSAGIGGHVNDTDKGDTIFNTLINGLVRELKEEIGITLTYSSLSVRGMINEEETEIGHCHVGVVFRIDIDPKEMQFDTEISNPTWIVPKNMNFHEFELWSKLAVKLAFDYE